MLSRYVEQLLNIYNYIDGIIITDKDGYVEYYKNFRPDLNNLKESEVRRKHITYFVNDYSLALGDEGRRAVERLTGLTAEQMF